VNITSPIKSDWIPGAAAGAVARISDRIIDCPVRVIVIAVDFGCPAAPVALTIENRTAIRIDLANECSVFNIAAICVASRFRLTVRFTRDLPNSRPSIYRAEILLVSLPTMIQMAEYNKSVSFNRLNCLDIRRSEPATAILPAHRGIAPASPANPEGTPKLR
jgi:hypothetical protein